MRYTKIFFIVFVLFLLKLPLNANGKILKETGNVCEFSYSPVYSVDTSGMYTFVSLGDGAFDIEEGEPEIPIKHFSIAIGEGSDVKIRIVGKKLYKTIRGLLPPGENIETNERKYKNKRETVSMGIRNVKKGYVRNVYTVSFDLCPIDFDESSLSIRMYKDIIVEVVSSKAYIPMRTEDPFSEIYKNLILNYRGINRTKKRIKRGFELSYPSIKIKMKSPGIYAIGYRDILASGIDPAFLDPRDIHVYTIGFDMMSLFDYMNDSIMETPVYVKGEKDGKFNIDDSIFIYNDGLSGFGKNSVMGGYSAYYNPYTDTTSFIIAFENTPGKRMETEYASLVNNNGDAIFSDTFHYENENLNPSTSGYVWLDTKLTKDATEPYRDYDFTFMLDSLRSDSGKIKIKMYTNGYLNFVIFLNGAIIYGDTSATSTRDYSFYPNERLIDVSNLSSGVNRLKIRLVGNQSQKHYLDYFEVYYNPINPIRISTDQWNFIAGEGDVRISLENITEPRLFDVENPLDVKVVKGFDTKNDTLRFHNDKSGKYVLMKSPLKAPYVERENAENLKNYPGADVVVLTRKEFKDNVDWLQSYHVGNIPGIQNGAVKIITLSDIYDNFSAGRTDVAAVKKFLNYAYDNWVKIPSYVIFVGSGSYDYKNLFMLSEPKNLFPVFEGGVSVVEQGILTANPSYDDWFADFDGNGYAEMIVARLPIKTAQDLNNERDKTESFIMNNGMWKNRMVLLADDEYGGYSNTDPSHTIECEKIASLASKEYDIRKVYSMNYWGTLQTADHWPSNPGDKPSARLAMFNALNKGAVGFAFVGHGNLNTLTHEHIISSLGQFDQLNNKGMYPIGGFYSCNVGNSDRALYDCIAEYIVNQKDKGFVASVAATRGTYGSNNMSLANNFTEYAFSDSFTTNREYTLGEAAYLAKHGTMTSNIIYNLFGDPLLVPHTRISGSSSVFNDTIKTGEKVNITLNIDSAVTGKAYVEVLSSAYPDSHDYYHTYPYHYLHYDMPGEPVFRGEVSFDSSAIHVSFVYPYNNEMLGDMGRIIAYIESDTNTFRFSVDSIDIVQGEKDTTDNDGPEIEMSVNGIKAGDDTITVSKDVAVMAVLSDKNGIALAGNKQIKVMIDNDVNKVYNISDYFSYDENSYTSGILNYSIVFPDTGGIHSITLIVYDNMMNVSYKTAYLNVIGDENLSVRNVWNWPNPMKSSTYFTFVVSRSVSATIKIFTITGKCIRTMEIEDLPAGYNQIYWDGRDNNGNEIAQGLYFYKILFKSVDGARIAVKSKLLIYR